MAFVCMRVSYVPLFFMLVSGIECGLAFEHFSGNQAGSLVLFGVLAFFALVNGAMYTCKGDVFTGRAWGGVFCLWCTMYLMACVVYRNSYALRTGLWAFSALTTQVTAFLCQ